MAQRISKKVATLLDTCRKHRRTAFLKVANPGDSTQAFESAFANLATASLQDRAPGLLDNLLGFELVEKSDENDRAIGIFGFKFGDQLLYSPVFFLNGELKGEELLYLADTDTFVPRDEQWTNYLKNRRPLSIGSGVDPQETRRNISTPSFDMFRELPVKYSSALADWSFEGVAKLLEITRGYKQPPLMVPNLIEKSASAAYSLLKLIDAYPTIANELKQCYGLGVIKRAMEKVREQNTILNYKSQQTKAAAASNLKIITDYNKRYHVLSSDENITLYKQGYLIKDAREKSSVAYRTNKPMILETPQETGLHEVFVKPGKLEQCFVALSPLGADNYETHKIVISTGDKKWTGTTSPDVLVSDNDLKKKYNSWLNKLPTTRVLSPKDVVIIINKDGKRATCVFEIEQNVGNNDGDKSFNIYCRSNSDYRARKRIMNNFAREVDSAYSYTYDNGTPTKLSISSKVDDFCILGDTLLVPKDAKVFKIKEEKGSDIGCPTECCGYNSTRLELGTQSDLKLYLIKNSSELKVFADDHEAYVNDKRCSLKEALFDLVRNHGLREKSAKEILNFARMGVNKFRIKYAANPYHLQGPGPVTDWPAESMPSQDMLMGSDMPMMVGQEQTMPFADMQGMSPEETPINELNEIEDLRRQLQQTAQTGQKEVFDTQLLGSLLKTTRDEAIIDEHMPALVKGLDAIGRLLFNMYWHNDQFAERFGDREVVEIEDALRNSFSQLGDLTMALKKREVGPRVNEGLDVDLAALGG